MIFNSLEFAFFFALCLLVYLPLRHRAQNRALLAASYVFYAAWDWRFLGLIVLSTLVDYAVALRLARCEEERRRHALVVLSVVTNLAILGTFKYAGFFVESLRELAALFAIELPAPALHMVLPVGISFYTFQSMGYTIDVYRRRVEPTKNLLDFALYVAFFPQLVAGPIERAKNLLPQVLRERHPTWQRAGSGAWLILWGIFKKVVIADNLVELVDAVYAEDGSTPTGMEVLIGTYAFAAQIYCDFSGYSDIARGLARVLGFELMVNFNIPYLAKNPAEFWRRWHISLSSWLRDYLYIPLGGNRRGTSRTYLNLLLTMLLGGLWHGAAWTFVAWGVYHGAWLALHRWLRPRLPRLSPQAVWGRRSWAVIRVFATFHLVCFGWLLFRAESLPHVLALVSSFAGPIEAGLALQWLRPLAILLAPLILVEAAQALKRLTEPVLPVGVAARAGIYALIFLTIVILGEDFGEAFIYFQF